MMPKTNREESIPSFERSVTGLSERIIGVWTSVTAAARWSRGSGLLKADFGELQKRHGRD